MPFFIKRNDQISGPFTQGQVREDVANGKLHATDFISQSKTGPWTVLIPLLGQEELLIQGDSTDISGLPESRRQTSSEVSQRASVKDNALEVVDASEISSAESTPRLQRLKVARHEYAGYLSERSRAEEARQAIVQSQTEFFQPLGAAVFNGYCTGQIPEMADLGPLRDAQIQLQDMVSKYLEKQTLEAVGIWQSTKKRIQLLMFMVRVKARKKSVKRLESSIGKLLLEDLQPESIRCEATKPILNKLEHWHSALAKANARWETSEFDLQKCRFIFEQEFNLKLNEGLASFDKAIQECE